MCQLKTIPLKDNTVAMSFVQLVYFAVLIVLFVCLQCFDAVGCRDQRSFEIRFEFESAVPIRFESTVMGRFENFSNRPCLPIARSSQTTQTINGA